MIERLDTDAGYMDMHLRLKINELIEDYEKTKRVLAKIIETQYTVLDTKQEKCPECHGVKIITQHYTDGYTKQITCPVCHGTGTMGGGKE